MTGDLENEAAIDHPGHAVVKPLTVGLDPWEAHQLGGDDNTTNAKIVMINRVQLRNYFGFFDLSLLLIQSVRKTPSAVSPRISQVTGKTWTEEDFRSPGCPLQEA